VPVIEPSGENSIISVPRANMRLTPADVERCAATIAAADALLLQMEVPVAASLAACAARRAQTRVLLNTAPAGAVPPKLLDAADIVIANESEAALLSGVAVHSVSDAFAAAERLRRRDDQAVIITLGAQGAVARAGEQRLHQPALPVVVRDTTGAGDAFCGALAVRFIERGDLAEALRWANAAGACAVTTLGAEPSLPSRERIIALLDTPAE